jgi:2-aminoadipate transaminase
MASETLAPPTAAAGPQPARTAKAVSQSMLREVFGLVAASPGTINLAVGLPAEDLFPTAELAEVSARLLAADRRSLQYGIPYQPLKAQVVDLMARRGVACREEQVFLTSGSQQGMDLLVRLFLEPGGTAMFERVVYDGIQMAVKRLEPRLLLMPTNVHTGLDVDSVAEVLAAEAPPAFLYVITDGHNPLGVSLAPEKRPQLVDLARRHRVPILEDDAYGFLYCEDSPAAPPLRAFDEQWVCYLGTFSKILAPGLRAGWVVVPEELVGPLAALKHSADLDTPSFSHRLISAFIETGALPAHLARVRAEYRRRRDAMLGALERHLAGLATWNHPTAGMFVWVELPAGTDTFQLVRTAITEERVAYSPGDAFAAGGSHARHCMRLAFANHTPEQIDEGVARLARAVARAFS